MTQPAGFKGTQTFLIECNRSQSKIDKSAAEDQNARWTCQTNFNLKVGDRVGVESCILDAAQSSTNQTIEFTKENVKDHAYSDNRVVIEFGFYISGNQRYSTLLPFKTKHHYMGKEPRAGNDAYAYPQLAGNTVTTQQCGVNSPQMPPLQQHIPANSVGFQHSMGKQYDVFGFVASATDTSPHLFFPTLNPADSATCDFIVISQFDDLIVNLANGDAGHPTPGSMNLYINDYYPPNGQDGGQPMAHYKYSYVPFPGTGTEIIPIDPSKNGWNTMYANFELTVGMGIDIEAATGFGNYAGTDPIEGRRVLGVISNIWSSADPNAPEAIKYFFNGEPGRLIVELRETYQVTQYDDYPIHSGVIGFSQYGGASQYNQYEKNGSASAIDNPDIAAGVAKPFGANLPEWDKKAKAGGNVGMLNWTTRFVKPRHQNAEQMDWNSNFYSSYMPGGTPSPWRENQEPSLVSTHFQGRRYTQTNSEAPDYLVNTYSTKRKLGGGMAWEVMRTNTDQLLMKPQECSDNVKSDTYQPDSTGIETQNYINFKDNTNYILVCPSYQGGNVINPNGTGFCPELTAMSAFVIIEATETFEDVNFLAEQITAAFHAVNPFQNLINTNSKSAIKSKPNNVIPYISKGHFPLYWTCADSTHFNLNSLVPTPANAPKLSEPWVPPPPNPAGLPQPQVAGLVPPKTALYTGIQPIWTGNLIKVLPANCRLPAPVMSKQKNDPFYYSPNENVDYGSSGGGDLTNANGRGTFRWCQSIYGNMGIKDFAKAWSGDRLNKRAHVWNMNDPYINVTNRNDCGCIVLLNTQIQNKWAKTSEPQFSDATTPAGMAATNWTNEVFSGAVIAERQALLTNMYYTKENCELLKLILRNNEKYDVNAPDAVSGFAAQNHPSQNHNWFYEFDIGRADDSRPMRDKISLIQDYWNTDQVKNSGGTITPWNPNFISLISASGFGCPQYLLSTLQGWWLENPNPMCMNQPYPCAFVSDRIVEGQGIPPIGTNIVNPNNELGVVTANRSMICPAQSTSQFFKRSYQNARRTGIIKVYSRYFGELDTDVNTPNFTMELNNSAGSAGSQTGTTNGMQSIAKDSEGNWLTDPTLSRTNNIGGTPYFYHTMATNGIDSGGNPIPEQFCQPKLFISFMSYKSYEPFDNNIESLELNQFGWGEYFGYSPSCYDNPKIIPTNSDPINLTQKLYKTPPQFPPSIPAPADQVSIDALAAQSANQSQYIWVGAGDATCVFDNVANRFKIGKLYTETLLPKIDTTETTGVLNIPAATPQIGEQMISLNSTQASAKQGICQEQADGMPPTDPFTQPAPVFTVYQEPGFPPTPWMQGTIQKPELTQNAPDAAPYPKNSYNTADQGINDTQCGCFIKNIYLAPQEWKPPIGIDLKNYYDPEILHEPDPTINMGNATDNASGATFVAGTKYTCKTKQNRDAIIAGLVEASETEWEGGLLDKCGFNFSGEGGLMPQYGDQTNRFSEFTYGRDDIKTMYQGVKPFMQNTQCDSAANIDLSVWAKQLYPTTVPANMEGTPTYGMSFLNNETINIGGLNVGSLAASRMPILFSSPFYKILSNIVEVQYQSSDTASNCIFIALKNYAAGGFLYIYSSTYTQLVDLDRTVSEVSTEIRNPITGRLAKLSPNSCIIYKIERDIFIPTATLDVNGENLLAPPVKQEGEENLQEMNKLLTYSPLDGEAAIDPIANMEAVVSHDIHGLELGGLPEGVEATLITSERHAERQYLEAAHSQIQSAFQQEHYIIDRPKLMKGIYGLVVEKALDSLRVIAKASGKKAIGFLNPYLITNAINNTLGKIAEYVSQIDGREGDIDPAKILEELRTDSIFLGADGKIVRRRGKIDGTLDGNYTFSPELLTKITNVLENGGGKNDLLQEIQRAIETREIGYKAKSEAGKTLHLAGVGKVNLEDNEQLYDAADIIHERESIENIVRKHMKGKLGGSKADRAKAVAMARRNLNDLAEAEGMTTAKEVSGLEADLLQQALSNPIAFMKSMVEREGETERPRNETSLQEISSLAREREVESRRGAIVKKGDDPNRTFPAAPLLRGESKAQFELDKKEAYTRQEAEDKRDTAAAQKKSDERRRPKSARKK